MMMHSPITAMLWVCWRRTWRWYCPVILFTFAVCGYAFYKAPDPVVVGKGLLILTFMLASLTSLSAVSLSNREGFPFRYQFRLPISTSGLVTVSLLYLNVLCASIVFLPLLFFKFLYDIPFPVVAPVALISLMVSLLLAASWTTTGTGTRGIALLSAITAYAVFTIRFAQLNFDQSAATGVIPLAETLTLSTSGFLLAPLMLIVLLLLTILSVRQQRIGDSFTLISAFTSLLNSKNTLDQSKEATEATSTGYFEKLSDKFTLPCPTSSPWRAETWFEMKIFGVPIILIGTMLALFIPVMFIASVTLGWTIFDKMAYLMPVGFFFTAIGITLFNRRIESGGYMNPFEASRGLSTVQLLFIQIGTLALSILIGLIIISLSLWLSTWALPVDENFLQVRIQQEWARLSGQPAGINFSEAGVALMYFITAILAFFCLHSCSVFWGKKFLIGLLILVLYILNYLMYLIFDGPTLESLIDHIWGTAYLIITISALGLAGMLIRRVMNLKNVVVVMALWGIFLVCAYARFTYQSRGLLAMPGELLALNIAAFVFPLGCFMLSAWCYDKLRHG